MDNFLISVSIPVPILNIEKSFIFLLSTKRIKILTKSPTNVKSLVSFPLPDIIKGELISALWINRGITFLKSELTSPGP